MLKILGHVRSINVRKALIACEEAGIEYEREDWGGGTRSLADPKFLALNPNGLVPVLIDGDYVLWESNAIGRYVAMRAGRTDLLPEDPKARGLVEQWIDWQATDLNRAWMYAFVGLVRKFPGYDDPAQIAASIKNWNRAMTLLDAQLQRTSDYVVGRTFTLADVGIGLATHRWFQSPIERVELPAVARYYARLQQRPAFKRYFDDGGP